MRNLARPQCATIAAASATRASKAYASGVIVGCHGCIAAPAADRERTMGGVWMIGMPHGSVGRYTVDAIRIFYYGRFAVIWSSIGTLNGH
jgi:hypothetical protein